MGSIKLYFTNEYINISYSKNRLKVCTIVNQKAAEQFDYCNLKEAILFLDKAIEYFIKGE